MQASTDFNFNFGFGPCILVKNKNFFSYFKHTRKKCEIFKSTWHKKLTPSNNFPSVALQTVNSNFFFPLSTSFCFLSRLYNPWSIFVKPFRISFIVISTTIQFAVFSRTLTLEFFLRLFPSQCTSPEHLRLHLSWEFFLLRAPGRLTMIIPWHEHLCKIATLFSKRPSNLWAIFVRENCNLIKLCLISSFNIGKKLKAKQFYNESIGLLMRR